MSKKTPIGYLKCFLCDFPDGEVKLDRNDNPYFYCSDCSCQVLTHGGNRGSLLKAKMKPVDLAVTKAVNGYDEVKLKKEVEEVTEKPHKKKEVKTDDFQKEEKPKKSGFGMMGGNL